MSNNAAEWLSVEKVADELELTAARIRQLLKAGILKGHKFSERAWLIHRDEVKRFKKLDRPAGNPAFQAKKARKTAHSR